MSLSTTGRDALEKHMPCELAIIVIQYIVLPKGERFREVWIDRQHEDIFIKALPTPEKLPMIARQPYAHVCARTLPFRYKFGNGNIGRVSYDWNSECCYYAFSGMCCSGRVVYRFRPPTIEDVVDHVLSQHSGTQHAYRCAVSCAAAIDDLLKRYA